MANPTELAHKGTPTDIWRYETPNTLAHQFVMPKGMDQMQGQTAVFMGRKDALGKSQLAMELLSVGGVTQVVLGSFAGTTRRDYVTVTFAKAEDWEKWKNLVYGKLVQAKTTPTYFATANVAAKSKTIPELAAEFANAGNSNEESIIKAVIAKTNEKMASHGGRIEFGAFDAHSGRLIVMFRENCAGCGSSEGTLKGLKTLLDSPGIGVKVNNVNLLNVPK